MSSVYAPITAGNRRNSKQPLYIGAVKANTGHGGAVAGVTALIKVLLVFEKEAIPRHIGVKTSINPNFPKDLDKRNLNIPWEQTPWARRSDRKRIAAINNFGAAGGNTTILLEEGPARDIERRLDPRGNTHVIAISAKSKFSLRGNLERYLSYLENHPDVSLPDLSYSTTARRYHHNHRAAVAVSTVDQAKKQLNSYLKAIDSHKPISPTGPPSVVFAFTGQGSSYKSSNYELFHASPTFRDEILHLDTLAQGQGFPSFIPAIDGSHEKDHQHSPVVTQLALVATEIALAKYWASLGVKPDVVVGHSLGEYAALQVAGVLAANDAIFLVGRRAQLLEQKCQVGSHKMLAVRTSLAQIEQVAGGKPYEVACVNGPRETVLSGTAEEIQSLVAPLETAGHKSTVLDVAFAFHSGQMDPILDSFEELAKTGVIFHEPTTPVISPLLGRVIFDGKTFDATYLRRATRETVNFLGALETAQRILTIDDSMVWVEIGPHPVSTSFVKATLPSTGVTVPSLRRGEDNWVTLAQSLATLHIAGVEVGWHEFHRPFEKTLRLLDLPTYAWNDKTYWLQYNGDWALTKGNTFYDEEKRQKAALTTPISSSTFLTSTVQQIVEEHLTGPAGTVVIQSDLMQPEFLAAAHGHSMNGCGVITSVSLNHLLYISQNDGHRLINVPRRRASMPTSLLPSPLISTRSSNPSPKPQPSTSPTSKSSKAWSHRKTPRRPSTSVFPSPPPTSPPTTPVCSGRLCSQTARLSVTPSPAQTCTTATQPNGWPHGSPSRTWSRGASTRWRSSRRSQEQASAASRTPWHTACSRPAWSTTPTSTAACSRWCCTGWRRWPT